MISTNFLSVFRLRTHGCGARRTRERKGARADFRTHGLDLRAFLESARGHSLARQRMVFRIRAVINLLAIILLGICTTQKIIGGDVEVVAEEAETGHCGASFAPLHIADLSRSDP